MNFQGFDYGKINQSPKFGWQEEFVKLRAILDFYCIISTPVYFNDFCEYPLSNCIKNIKIIGKCQKKRELTTKGLEISMIEKGLTSLKLLGLESLSKGFQ